MANGKAPGLDQFPVEWYETYIDLLAPRLHRLYDIFREGISSTLFNQAYITVIPKPSKDQMQYANYHPIFLLILIQTF